MDVRLSRSALLRGVAGGAVATYLSFRGSAPDVVAQESADERAIEALENDDTEGAVEVWEAEFKEKPFDDDVRQALQASLVVHASRCLDKGKLIDARRAVARAKEVVSSAPAYGYLDEAIRSYVEPLYQDDMRLESNYTEIEDERSETRYIEIPGLLGNQTKALAITEKEVGWTRFYSFSEVPVIETGRISFRPLVFPMSDNGRVVIMFGMISDRDYWEFVINTAYGYGPNWYISQCKDGVPIYPMADGSSAFGAKSWHELEIRIRGQSVEIWLDYALIAREVAVDLGLGELAFGVGLPSDASGATFTAAFDDLVVYSLK